MTLDNIDITAAIADVEQLLREEKDLSPAMAAAIKVLLLAVKLLAGRLGMNSRNSSKPPSSDPNRDKKKRTPRGKKPGGQPGHTGSTLEPVDTPDEVQDIKIDKRSLPAGNYQDGGYERRQVVDIHIRAHVTEFRAQKLIDADGHVFVAEFPPGVTRPVQYGHSVKAHAVHLSMFQLIPYERVQAQFAEYGIPISTGTLCNFNQDAFERLVRFEQLARRRLIQASALHADETGINVNGQRIWLHNASSERWTLFHPDLHRGKEAMDAMGILPHFRGILIHDHWKPYYVYDACTHALCNAHHLRELTYAHEQDGQQWADHLSTLLLDLDKAVTAAGALSEFEAKKWRRRYRKILKQGDAECPPPPEPAPLPVGKRKRGRVKRSKSRNLLERLRDHEGDVLRFMVMDIVPFTNNQGERDIRMTKVQQKISGCFRSMEGAQIFCRIRSYLSTCSKHGVGAGDALKCLFEGQWPDFIQVLL